MESQRREVFTKIQLALFGEFPWDRVPLINPELMFLPKRAPIDIYEFSSWSRSVIIPLLIVFAERPVCVLDKQESISEVYLPLPEASAQEKILRMIEARKVNFQELRQMASSTKDQIAQILRTRTS